MGPGAKGNARNIVPGVLVTKLAGAAYADQTDRPHDRFTRSLMNRRALLRGWRCLLSLNLGALAGAAAMRATLFGIAKSLSPQSPPKESEHRKVRGFWFASVVIVQQTMGPGPDCNP